MADDDRLITFEASDVVRLVRFVKTFEYVRDAHNLRRPKVGDVARVLKVYRSGTPGYQLECKDGRGKKQWVLSFRSDEIDLELVGRADQTGD